MSITLKVDTSNLSRGMAGFVGALHLNAGVVLRKEMGELAKTLIKLTPPAEPSKTRERIMRTVSGRFEQVGDASLATEVRAGKQGAGGITWYSVDSSYLRGVAPTLDARKASAEDLKGIFYTLKREGGKMRRMMGFRYPRRQQRVLLIQRVLSSKTAVRRLAERMAKHVGRLKAGWLVSLDHLNPGGGNQPPQWVTRHRQGARGYVSDFSKEKNLPNITIANTAAAVGSDKNKMEWIARNAIAIRSKAMAANLLLFMKGKKNVADYARA